MKPIFEINESDALSGGAAAGDYLESIQKFDLSELSEAQWLAFCTTLIRGALDSAMDRHFVDLERGSIIGADEIPF